MKKLLWGVLALLVVAVAGLGYKYSQLKEQKLAVDQQYATTKASEDSLRVRFDTALASIAEIQDSLTVILPSESNVMHVSQDVESGGKLTASRKSQVLRTISDLNESIQRSKEMIRRLEQRLKDRDIRVAALERIVAQMKRSVADREQMIASLTQRVESLKVQVESLKTDVAAGQQQISAQQQVIEDKRREISTIYYMVGTKKKLKELGMLQESGGLIGIGKSARLSGQFPEAVFNKVDTDVQTVISVPGKKPVVLSSQSSNSYQIVPISLEMSELRITNAQEFRRVRYLVIQVDQSQQ